MKFVIIIVVSLFIPFMMCGMTAWNGNGDGHSWQDDSNWSNGAPENGEIVEINLPAMIDGSSVTIPKTIIIQRAVTLDLDLIIGNGVSSGNCIDISALGEVVFGAGHTISLNPSPAFDGIHISNHAYLTIEPSVIVNITTGKVGVNLAPGTLYNMGAINISGMVRGIHVGMGDSYLTNDGNISISSSSDHLFNFGIVIINNGATIVMD